MMNLLASPWIPTGVLVLLACGARVLSKTWLAPGPFALLVWSVYLVVPQVLAPEYGVPAIGVWLILLLIVCIAIGADLGMGQEHGGLPVEQQASAAKKLVFRLTVFLSGVSLLGVLYSAWKGLA